MARSVRRLAPLLLLVFVLLPIPRASAATLIVTRFDDPGPPFSCQPVDCSLREAVIAANTSPGADIIPLIPGTYRLTIPATNDDASLDGDLDFTEAGTTVIGTGATSTVIDSSQVFERAFDVLAPGTTAISRVTITGGNTPIDGAGLLVQGPSVFLDLSAVAVTGNTTSGFGGGIFVKDSAQVGITNSTISGNTSTHMGGGISSGGVNFGFVSLAHSTIIGNSADSDGDGVGDGGGIHAGMASLFLSSSIVAGNSDGSPAPSDKDPNCSGPVASQGHNIVGDVTGCTFTPAPGDQVGTGAAPVDPHVGPLSDNGGPTPTHALLPGSPAIDAGQCFFGDQRGIPAGGLPQTGGNPCDIGSYELVLCKGIVVNKVGTAGDDVLAGTNGTEGFATLAGNDKVTALGGKDAACLGDGNDRASGGGGKDKLLGERGKDRLRGEGGNDLLLCGSNKDRGQGGPGKDRLKDCEKGKP